MGKHCGTLETWQYSHVLTLHQNKTIQRSACTIDLATYTFHSTQDKMVLTKQVILTDKAPKPLSVLNQGLVVGDMVYCSGQVGTDPATGELVEGTVADRAVS